MCAHEKNCLEIVSTLKDIDKEKYPLHCKIVEIYNYLDEVAGVFDDNPDMPIDLLETFEEEEEGFKNELEKLETTMEELDAKKERFTKMWHDQKEAAIKDKCFCVNNFKCEIC